MAALVARVLQRQNLLLYDVEAHEVRVVVGRLRDVEAVDKISS